jgi:drug/metabolite transporter (DMT)-like permease
MGLRSREPLLFLLLGAIWGSAYLAVKIGGEGIGPFEFVAVRLAIGGAFLATVAALRGERLPGRGDWPHVAVVGLTGLVVPFLLITWGQRGVDAGLASVFNAATPLFTLGLAAAALADEPLRTGRAVGIGIGFAGIVLVTGSGIVGGGDPLSIAAILLAVFSYAVTGVYVRRFLRHTRPLGLAVGQVAVGLSITAPLALFVEGGSLRLPSGTALWALLWLGVAASGIAPLLFFRLISAWGANRTALVNYLIPMVGVAAGAAVLGERLEPRTLVGGVIVVIGMAVASRAPELRLPWLPSPRGAAAARSSA